MKLIVFLFSTLLMVQTASAKMTEILSPQSNRRLDLLVEVSKGTTRTLVLVCNDAYRGLPQKLERCKTTFGVQLFEQKKGEDQASEVREVTQLTAKDFAGLATRLTSAHGSFKSLSIDVFGKLHRKLQNNKLKGRLEGLVKGDRYTATKVICAKHFDHIVSTLEQE